MTGIVGPNTKQDFWENIVLPDLGVTPGTYVSPTITVSNNGLITAITPSVIALPVVENVASLSSIPGPVAGVVAVVLDDGGGNIVLYGYRLVPSPGWYQITTPPAATTVSALSQTFTNASTHPLLIGTVTSTKVIKRISISITTAFTGGTAFTVVDSNAVVWLNSTDLDPTVPGTYELDLLDNNTPVGVSGTSISLTRTGSPVAGAGLVFVEYV